MRGKFNMGTIVEGKKLFFPWITSIGYWRGKLNFSGQDRFIVTFAASRSWIQGFSSQSTRV
jgi:hypothetical protein